MSILCVKKLGKAYKDYPNQLIKFAELVSPFHQELHQKKWVLKDVNFEVANGEAIGVLGVNGAGKSTLLKLITGTTSPTTGQTISNGRIAALLELGMGFHPEFTGRQNVYMAGQLQGYSKTEIESAFNEIEKFAAIGRYIDQPLRVYSSGMQMRLAFAVATAYRPELLIIDEALSVGDAAFQRKCFARIESFQEQGTALLIVSHSIETINRICSKALLLQNGEMKAFGNAKEVTQLYEETLYGTPEKKQDTSQTAIFDESLTNSAITKEYGNKKAVIQNFRIIDENHNTINTIQTNQPFAVTYDVAFKEDAESISFGTMIKTVEDICVYGKSTRHTTLDSKFMAGDVVSIKFEMQNHLAPGIYYLNCGCETSNENQEREYFHRLVDVAIIKVTLQDPSDMYMGLANLDANISLAINASVSQ